MARHTSEARLTWLGAVVRPALVCLVAGAAAVSGAQEADPQGAALARLREESRRPVKIQFESGVPTFASFEVRDEAAADPVARALAFLDRYRELYGLRSPAAETLYLERMTTSESGQHLFFGQRREAVPVFASQLAVHLGREGVVGTNGKYLPEVLLLPPAAVSEDDAVRIATKHLAEEDARVFGQPRPVYFNASLFLSAAEGEVNRLDDRTTRAWQLTLRGSGHGWTYFVDDTSGRVLFRLDLSHEAAADLRIRTANNTSGFLCSYFSGTDWFDENGIRPSVTPDAEGMSSFPFANTVYDFYKNNFGWRSWNGTDGQLSLILDDSGLPGNAQFDGMCKHFEFGNNMATLDVIAHEITHGVTENTSGLGGSNQPGALNESYSDVFASLIDGNFTIGEGTPGGAFRDLSRPPRFGDPDDMSKFVITSSDSGGVHTNCGIPNKVAFLLMAGGTHNGVRVLGLGKAKTGQLYFDVMKNWLNSNASFASQRNVTLAAATTLAATGRFGFTARDVCDVQNAFASVFLGLPDADCDGVDDTVDPDDDNDTVPDAIDNCPFAANPSQSDADRDGMGDACDGDKDNDGLADAVDNCPLVPNPGQADINLDGIGDACDPDLDGDGVPNAGDNCPAVRNTNQMDSDSDLTGDACDSCPYAYDSPFDTDGDGINNACDDDDDNDGVLDVSDNCPTVKNPNQQDLDGDGVGAKCDSDEMVRVGSDPAVFAGAFELRREFFERQQQLPILPDLPRFGRDWIPENFMVTLHVQVEGELPVQVVDDRGLVVAIASSGKDTTLRFHPDGAFLFRTPDAKDVAPFTGREYFLEPAPQREGSERRYGFDLDATTGTDPSSPPKY
jgi:Zn-dependent metalloprotease